MPTLIQELGSELDAKRKALDEHFALYPDFDVPADKDVEYAAESKRRMDEINALSTKRGALQERERQYAENKAALDDLQRVDRTVPHASGARDAGPAHEQKSLGQLFIESAAFKQYNPSNQKGPIAEAPYSVKTLMTESAGFAPQAIRTGLVVPSAQQQPKIVDVIPSITTTMVAVVYMLETTYTNNAAEIAEDGTYPEAALAYTEETSPVRKIGVSIPVTDEQLADINGMQERINNRLLLMLRQRLDRQLVSGNGTPPNLTGILNTSNILTQAQGSDVSVDALYKGIVKAQSVGFVEPTAILMHPNDWQDIRLLKTTTGIYLFGYPGQVGPEMIWGLPLVKSTYMTENTAILGDFQGYTELAYKAGIEFEVTNSHSTDFLSGVLRIRAQFRCAFTVTRPSALVSVTGLT